MSIEHDFMGILFEAIEYWVHKLFPKNTTYCEIKKHYFLVGGKFLNIAK